VTDGPYTEAKEVIGGYAQFELKSKEEAIQGAKHFMELHKQHWPGWKARRKFARSSGRRTSRNTFTSFRGRRGRRPSLAKRPGLRSRIEA